jgi:uncharacterized protein YxjI
LATPVFDSHPRSRTRYLGHDLCPKLQRHAHCDRQKEKLRFFDNDVGRLGHRTTLPERVCRAQASQPAHLTAKKVVDAGATCENIEIETQSAGSFYGVKITNKKQNSLGNPSMRYLMKQKIFAWGDDFTIKDEAGNDAFFVDGRAFSIGKKLSFQDMSGNELAFIRQKLLSLGPSYEISRTRGNKTAAQVSKRWFSLRDTYGVDVAEGEDDVLILASTVVIDMVCHADKEH